MSNDTRLICCQHELPHKSCITGESLVSSFRQINGRSAMSHDNGEPDGLWPDENQLVPLSSSSAAVAPSLNGARPPWLDGDGGVARPIRLSAGEFTTERMLRPAPNLPSGGWRRAVFTLSAGHIAMGPSPEELRQRALVARVKTPVAGCRKIAFISRKGGVGKTSTCLLVGHTFAIHRGDR